MTLSVLTLATDVEAGRVPSFVEAARVIRPRDDDFRVQAEIVNDYADLRMDRAQEILDQIGGNIGYFSALLPIVGERMPYTLELLGLVQTVAAHVAQGVKHLLACRRPHAYSAQIQPMIPTPGHGALPSGHATEAFALAETLRRLVPLPAKAPGTDDILMAQAARIAVNRTVAGLHFPADSFCGAVLGFVTADFIAARAGLRSQMLGASFTGTGISRTDFHLAQIWQAGVPRSLSVGDVELVSFPGSASGSIDASESVEWLWQQASDEWR